MVFDGIRKVFFDRFYNDWHEENILLESSILKAMDIGKKNLLMDTRYGFEFSQLIYLGSTQKCFGRQGRGRRSNRSRNKYQDLAIFD